MRQLEKWSAHFCPTGHVMMHCTANSSSLQSNSGNRIPEYPLGDRSIDEHTVLQSLSESLTSPKRFPSTNLPLENNQKQSAKFKQLLITMHGASEKMLLVGGEEIVIRSYSFLPQTLQWLLRTCKIIPKSLTLTDKALCGLAPAASWAFSLTPHSLCSSPVSLLLSLEHSSFLLLDLNAVSSFRESLANSLHSAASFLSPPQKGAPLDQPKTIPPSNHSLSHHHILLSP